MRIIKLIPDFKSNWNDYVNKKKKSDRYYEEFDLTKDPFPVDSYDNILFLTPELTNRIQRIKKLIAETDKLIVVSSVSGAGKSSLADYLESIKEKNWRTCLVQAESDMDRESLSYEIMQQVSPDRADDKGMSIPQLHKLLELSSKTEKTPVFIIDDADKLPINTLTFILELSALKYQDTSFHFVLFANEALNDKLNNEPLVELSAQLVSNVHLPSFSLVQLKEYIDNRLGSSGEINEYPFTDADIEKIYRITAGLPKGTNILARQQMISSLSPESGLKPVIKLSIAAVVVIFIAGGFYFTSTQSPDNDESRTVIVAPPQPVPAPVVETIPPAELSIPEPLDEPDSVSEDIAAQDSDSLEDSFSGAEPIVEDVVEEEIEAITDTQEIEVAFNENIPEPADTADSTEIMTDTQQQMQATIQSAPEVVSSVPVGENITEQQTVLASNEIVTTATELQLNDNLSTNDGNIYQLDTIPVQLRGLKGENWYREQPRSSYVLQLISASELDNVLTLIEGLEDFHEDMSGYVKYTPSGRPRYLLFFGHYDDREDATNSASSIPEKLRSINPYPRSIGSMIDEIEDVGYWPR